MTKKPVFSKKDWQDMGYTFLLAILFVAMTVLSTQYFEVSLPDWVRFLLGGAFSGLAFFIVKSWM